MVKQLYVILNTYLLRTPSYANTIILGLNFMTYYATVFDAKDTTPSISIYSFPSQNPPPSHIINLSDASGYGYQVLVDFDPTLLNTKLSQYTSKTDTILLALYSSNTLLFGKCYDFQVYDCDNYNSCPNKALPTVSLSYPYFSITGQTTIPYLFINSLDWTLNSSAIYSKTCTVGNSITVTSYSGFRLYWFRFE